MTFVACLVNAATLNSSGKQAAKILSIGKKRGLVVAVLVMQECDLEGNNMVSSINKLSDVIN